MGNQTERSPPTLTSPLRPVMNKNYNYVSHRRSRRWEEGRKKKVVNQSRVRDSETGFRLSHRRLSPLSYASPPYGFARRMPFADRGDSQSPADDYKFSFVQFNPLVGFTSFPHVEISGCYLFKVLLRFCLLQ